MNRAQLITAVETEFPLIERKDIREPRFFWHYHRVIEIFTALDGSGNYVVGDGSGEFHPRDLFVVGPGVPHSFHMLPGDLRRHPIRILVVSLQESHEAVAAFLHYSAGKSWLSDAQHGFRIPARHSGPALAALQKLKNRRSPAELSAVITVLQTLAASRRRERLSRSTAGPVPEKAAGRLNRIYSYIHSHLQEPVQLPDLARTAGMSVPTLCRVFKRTAGKTVIRYIQECRISQACRQLIESDRSIAEIAYASGFNSLPHFNRVFREFKQTSPRDYRRAALS